jgi:hypothetical protein
MPDALTVILGGRRAGTLMQGVGVVSELEKHVDRCRAALALI